MLSPVVLELPLNTIMMWMYFKNKVAPRKSVLNLPPNYTVHDYNLYCYVMIVFSRKRLGGISKMKNCWGGEQDLAEPHWRGGKKLYAFCFMPEHLPELVVCGGGWMDVVSGFQPDCLSRCCSSKSRNTFLICVR